MIARSDRPRLYVAGVNDLDGSPRSERGAATFVVAGVLAVVMSLAVAGMLLGGYVVAVHRGPRRR